MISNDRIRDRVVVAYAERMVWVDDIRSYDMFQRVIVIDDELP